MSQLSRRKLDWIVMKAVEKDRNRRYDTASGFAADVTAVSAAHYATCLRNLSALTVSMR